MQPLRTLNSALMLGVVPAPTSCPTASQLGADRTPPLDCKYIYVRDNVPQGFGALLLAASELEF